MTQSHTYPPMSALERILGDRLDRQTRALLMMLLLSVTGQYAFFPLFPVWAISHLGISGTAVGLGLSIAGVCATVTAPLSGWLSDRMGRKNVLLTGLAVTSAAPLPLLYPHPLAVVGLGVFAAYSAGTAVRLTIQQALFVDLVAAQRHEAAFASARMTYNVGASLGTAAGGMLVLFGFRAMFAVAATLAAAALLVTWLLVPTVERVAHTAHEVRPSRLLLSRVVWSMLLASFLAWCVYQALELLLPISLTQSHGYSPTSWALLFLINPVLVAALQVRLIRWMANVSRYVKLTLGCLLMGAAFALVPLSSTLPVAILLIVVFTVGEILFGPNNQALVAETTPAQLRGTAMGLLTSTTLASVAVTPGLGMTVRAAYGDSVMWWAIATLGVLVAAFYAGPLRLAARQINQDPRPTESS